MNLTKDVREKLGIREGDRAVLNLAGDILMISKNDSKIFDKFSEFLPERFGKTLRKLRSDEKERLKRLGIIE